MKFKKEDVGLYFTLGLVGAGVGLLVGAFIASKRGGPTTVYIPEEEEYGKENSAMDDFTPKIPRKKKRVKKLKFEPNPELDAFIEEYQPSAIQIEMVKKGLLTLESLENTLIKEELANQKEPYNYNGPYLNDEKPELRDLIALPEDEEVINDRYQILRKPPKRKSPKNMRVIYFDEEDKTLYTMTRQKQPVPIGSINEFISEEAWEVLLPYMLMGFVPLFVNDLQTAKYYRFEIVPGGEEELSEDNASHE